MNFVETWARPIADGLNSVVFFALPLAEAQLPLVVLWLVLGAVYFTIRFRFVAIWGFRHAVSLVFGTRDKASGPGEVSHFQALATAVSGTVGIGNIGGVAIAVFRRWARGGVLDDPRGCAGHVDQVCRMQPGCSLPARKSRWQRFGGAHVLPRARTGRAGLPPPRGGLWASSTRAGS